MIFSWTTTTRSLCGFLVVCSIMKVAIFFYGSLTNIDNNNNEERFGPDVNNYVILASEKPKEKMTEKPIRKLMKLNKLRSKPWSNSPPLKRIGVVTYLPNDVKAIFMFTSMLYGSWKYNILHYTEMLSPQERDEMNIIDLIVVVHSSIAEELSVNCKLYRKDSASKKRNTDRFDGDSRMNYVKFNGDNRLMKQGELKAHLQFAPICWKIIQSEDKQLKNQEELNSIRLFHTKEGYEILRHYDYIIYTGADTFLSPSLLTMNLNFNMTVGLRTQCDDFNRRRLRYISLKLNMNHQGADCLAHSPFGKTEKMIRFMRHVWNVTSHILQNEFKSSLPALNHMNFNKTPNGQWPFWYRPDSVKYSIEVALNHRVRNLMHIDSVLRKLDVSSCEQNQPIKSVYSVKYYHGNCCNLKNLLETLSNYRFLLPNQKKEFLNTMTGYLLQEVNNITNIPVNKYSQFIAWHSAAKYSKLIVQELKANQKNETPASTRA